MKHYSFSIANNHIEEYEGEVSGTSSEYKHYKEKSFGVEEIYYKTVNGKITDIICEAFDLNSAKKATSDFLSNL